MIKQIVSFFVAVFSCHEPVHYHKLISKGCDTALHYRVCVKDMGDNQRGFFISWPTDTTTVKK